jgi:hypothetical protein
VVRNQKQSATELTATSRFKPNEIDLALAALLAALFGLATGQY